MQPRSATPSLRRASPQQRCRSSLSSRGPTSPQRDRRKSMGTVSTGKRDCSRSSPPRTPERSTSIDIRRSPGPSSTSSGTSSWRLTKPQLQRQRSDDTQETFIRVVARVRPQLPHESRASAGVDVDLEQRSLTLTNSRVSKTFGVDHVFDSRQEQGSQENVFSTFGRDFVNHSLNGYNICMFAYGHTGSGKSYTMLGDQRCESSGVEAGILPRFLQELFAAHALDQTQVVGRHYSCEFYEVYNEQIKDLLVPAKSGERTCKVHVHPKHGVRVENLTMSVVTSAEETLQLVEFGTQMRAVAATTMNARSSRSHAIFTIKYEQQTSDGESCQSTATFVDLAGREDQSMSQNQASQFREMCCINTSLFHLTTVITKLSRSSLEGRSLVDFRNSKLTLLLSPALIGNSRTALIATVAPLRSLIDDSLCTMNFAASVKKIKTRPVINNKAPNTLVAELEAEVRQLRSELCVCKTGEAEKDCALSSAQALINNYKQSWEEALEKSHELEMARKKSLRSLGLSVECSPATSDRSSQFGPFFTKLSDDPAMQGHCNYFLRGENLRLGSSEAHCNVVLQGLGITPEMCEVRKAPCGDVVIELLNTDAEHVPRVLVNGHPLSPSDGIRTISHGACVLLGYSNAFRFVVPSRDVAAQVGSTHPCVLARSMLEKLDVTSALHDVVEDAGVQFKEILPYISHLSTHLADSTVRSFMAALHRICPSIDEANLITQEVLGDSGLYFELQALTNVFKFGQDAPELVVCLSQSSSPQAIMYERAQTTDSATSDASQLLGKAQHPLVHEMGLSEHMQIGGTNVLLYVWSLEKFLGRLSAIREIYQQGSEMKDSFESVRRNLAAKPDQNPWRETVLGDVQLLMENQSIECSVAAHQESNQESPEALSEWQLKCLRLSKALSSSTPREALSARYSDDIVSATSSPITPATSHECSSASGNMWATALGAKVDLLGAQVAQLQETLSRQQAGDAAEASDALSSRAGSGTMSGYGGSRAQGVTHWLSQVEDLRNTLKSYSEKVTTELPHVSAPASPIVVTNEGSQQIERDVEEEMQRMMCKNDVVEMLQEEVKDQLHNLNLDRASSSGSTDCPSGQCSGITTPANVPECVVWRPRPSLSRSGSDETLSTLCPRPALPPHLGSDEILSALRPRPCLSRSGSDETLSSETSYATHRSATSLHQFGPSAGTVRKASPGPRRTALVTQKHLQSCRQEAPRLRSTWTAGSIASTLSTKAAVECLSTSRRARTPSKSPSSSRRFVGPYPKLTLQYYEVCE